LQGIKDDKDILPVLLDETPLPNKLRKYQFIDFQSIIRIGHPWYAILEELAQLIALKLTVESDQVEKSWWTALMEKKSVT
jgi:hypothetical protein